MTDGTNLPLFLGSVVALSLSGVMMPGPVTAVTVANGTRHKAAGALVAVGHGVIELPVMLLIYFGLARLLDIDGVKIGVGLAGGILLMWMALQVFKVKPASFDENRDVRQGSIVGGLATTATNPYFFLWWATIGAPLLVDARAFGGGGVAAMGATHWICDAAWLFLVSWVVFKSKRWWTPSVHRWIFGVCALVLAGFGVWFIYSGIEVAVAG